MTRFLSDEEFSRYSHDPMAVEVAEIADAFITRMYKDFKIGNVNEKDAQLEKMKKVISKKRRIISQLKEKLQNHKWKLQTEKVVAASLKTQYDTLAKDNEDLSLDFQALSKQLEYANLGKTISPDTLRDTKIKLLFELLLETREALRVERVTRKDITKSNNNVTEQKSKLLDELEKHKQAVKAATDEIEKLKNDHNNHLQGASAVELPPVKLLDDLTCLYLGAVENFERATQPVCNKARALIEAYTSATDTLKSILDHTRFVDEKLEERRD